MTAFLASLGRIVATWKEGFFPIDPAVYSEVSVQPGTDGVVWNWRKP